MELKLEVKQALAPQELILWALPRGSNDWLDAKVLYTRAKTMADIDRVKAVAAQDGWHSFKVQVLDGQLPNFTTSLQQ